MPTITNSLTGLRNSVADLRQQLETHRLYREIKTAAHMRLFLESHVFAVWDFMSLLKSLQNSLTSTSVPWIPSPFPDSRRLINEIVLGEESDEYQGAYLSHFELYLVAMQNAGADTGPVHRFLWAIQLGSPVAHALDAAGVPFESQRFVAHTFETIEQGKPHVIASAFTFGREDLIPAMFSELVTKLKSEFPGLAMFDYYLRRHIEVDGESHGPMALRMVEDLCGDSEQRWLEAGEAAKQALEARLLLWDSIVDRIAAVRASR
jgi:hypothetical protein